MANRGKADCPSAEYLAERYVRRTLRLRKSEMQVLEQLTNVMGATRTSVALEALALVALERGLAIPDGYGVDQRSSEPSAAGKGSYTVYALLDEDGSPRYVGRTKRFSARVATHLSGRSSAAVSAWVLACMEAGRPIRHVVLADGLSLHDGVRAEQRFITRLRRRFPLLNKHGRVH